MAGSQKHLLYRYIWIGYFALKFIQRYFAGMEIFTKKDWNKKGSSSLTVKMSSFEGILVVDIFKTKRHGGRIEMYF